MWKITICYYTIKPNKKGKMMAKTTPKFRSKVFETKAECRSFELDFWTKDRRIMWTYTETFPKTMDEWLE